MKTGVIVYGMHSDSAEERRVAERCAEVLKNNGRKNVHIGFYNGEPAADKVMHDMFLEGIDTFVLLPLTVAEGRMTIWLMPAKVHLPDNCGSWTILDGKDVATRFATALGEDPKMRNAILERLGEPDDKTGILLFSRGSPLSLLGKTEEYFAESLRSAGWKVSCGYLKHKTSVKEAVDSLIEYNIETVKTIPLFIGFGRESKDIVEKELEGSGKRFEILESISDYPEFYEILDSKVPEGW